jgi:TM2 domain-containing membrane protein YozV
LTTEQARRPALDEMFCSTCGDVIKKHAEICPHCGVRVRPAATAHSQLDPNIAYSEKSRLAAGLLGIFLGGFGIHRFYLGSIGIGILQIILTIFTLGIASLWGFIEGIIIIAGGNWRDAHGRPLKPHGT